MEKSNNNTIITTTNKTNESINYKKYYCCSNIKFLDKTDYKDIGIILIQNNYGKLIIECADGCRIDLNKIHDEKIILQIYNIIHSRITKLEK